MTKYRLLREAILSTRALEEGDLEVPEPVSDTDLLRVHEAAYVERVKNGSLAAAAQRRIGFPWSPELVERSRRSAGGTLAACRAALEEVCAVNLAGGTHHAFPDHGEGFCVFNDVAIAIRTLQAEGRIRRALVVDCDVHQGNGTAVVFAGDSQVFTLSIHGRKNFPFRKQESDLDIEIDDGTGDEGYLEALSCGLEQAFGAAEAELVLYVAGADPFAGDRLGRLSLSKEGLERRDRKVLGACRAARIPVAVVMAGGYADRVEDIVEIHLQTVRAAVELSESTS